MWLEYLFAGLVGVAAIGALDAFIMYVLRIL